MSNALRFRALRLGFIALAIAAGESCMAQQSDEDDLALAFGDRSTVSIATGARQPLRRAPAVATVITAEDIAAIGATDLDQVMETVPGVHVSHTAAFFTPSYNFRGMNGDPTNSQVLLLQNGISVNSMYRGDKGQSWGGLPLENVARIEIIRGPGSALYGADAFSGVINIITKTAESAAGTEVGARVGSFNTKDAWIQHGGRVGAVDVAAYLRVGVTDGAKEIVSADAATRLDRLFGTHASLAPGPVNLGHDAVDASLILSYEKWRWRAAYKLRNNVGTGAGVSSALDPVGKERSERITSDLSWNDPQFARNWEMGFTGSYLYYSEDASNYNLFPPGTQFPTGTFPNGMMGSPGRWERQVRVSAYAAYSGFTGHSLRFGLGHEDLNLYKVRTLKNFLLDPTGLPIPTGPVTDFSSLQPHVVPHKRLNNYFYAQDEWSFAGDWALTAGLRRDNFSDFGGTTNPRLALVWDASLDLTAKLLYGQAFRAPSFAEQYGVNPVANGNPDLKPESTRTLEAALSWQTRKDTQINLSLFRYAMKDTIRAVPNAAAGTGSTFANTGKQNGHGAELELVWDVRRTLRLTGNYSWQRSIDVTTDSDAGYVPHKHVYARADWRFAGNWLLSPQINWVADRKRAFGDTRPDIPDYTSVDLTLRTGPGKGQWGFAASIRNLFNSTILDPTLAPGTALPNDLPMPGRSLWAEVRFDF